MSVGEKSERCVNVLMAMAKELEDHNAEMIFGKIILIWGEGMVDDVHHNK